MYSSVHFSSYKSFDNSFNNSLADLQRVNVFIGKNNSGKSSAMDVVSCVYDIKTFISMKQKISSIDVDIPIQRQHIDSAFSGYSTIGNYRGAEQFWSAHSASLPVRVSVGYRSIMRDQYNWEYKRTNDTYAQNLSSKITTQMYDMIVGKMSHDAASFAFKRLSAERNMQVKSDDKLLWEVFLQEEGRERYALSQSGGGLKTIILLLLNLLVIPATAEYSHQESEWHLKMP